MIEGNDSLNAQAIVLREKRRAGETLTDDEMALAYGPKWRDRLQLVPTESPSNSVTESLSDRVTKLEEEHRWNITTSALLAALVLFNIGVSLWLASQLG